MKKTLIIEGELSKVFTSIPALEKFVTNNPDCTIVVHEFGPIFWGNKKLSNFIFDNHTKDLFNRIKNTKIIKPDPYYNIDFLNGKIHLVDAWNQEINGDKDPMPVPKMYIQEHESKVGLSVKRNYFNTIIAFQPFSKDVEFLENEVKDKSCRSMRLKLCKEIIKRLKLQGYGIWLITDRDIPVLSPTDFIQLWPTDVRSMASILSQCDYFLGVDGSGQHFARSFNIPGTVVMGGSNTTNFTYPDHFNIVNDKERDYMPYGLADFDRYIAEANNDKLMNLSDKEIKDLCNNIIKHIKKTVKK